MTGFMKQSVFILLVNLVLRLVCVIWILCRKTRHYACNAVKCFRNICIVIVLETKRRRFWWLGNVTCPKIPCQSWSAYTNIVNKIKIEALAFIHLVKSGVYR